MYKYIFLDVDGVLNDERNRHDNGAHGMDPACVARLNRIIEATDPEIVISSSWRNQIHRGHMNLTGFQRLIMSHGIDCCGRLAGITEPDDYASTRGELISRWLAVNASKRDRYLVLDDGAYWLPWALDHGIRAAGHGACFIQTNYRTGLTNSDVIKAIKILNGVQESLIRKQGVKV